MVKRSAADTITAITGSKTFSGSDTPTPAAPTPEELIEKIRTRLAKQTVAAEAALDAADPENERKVEPAKAMVAQARENQKTFEDMMENVPNGFHLVPVFYNRITMEENDAVKEEYSYNVRPRFLKFVADNHEAELRQLGISDEGVKRMKGGLDPVDEKGDFYNINIDHIIERAGSGMMGKTKSADPDRPGSNPTFDINHFGNFVLIPEKVHEYKNVLNDLQEASDMPYAKGKWILMMTPERNAKHSGFVAQPQPAGSKLEGIETHPLTVRHSEFIVQTTRNEINDLKNTGKIRETVRKLVADAGKWNRTVAEAAEAEAASKAPNSLLKAFNAAVAKEPEADTLVNGLIRPALKDVTDSVTKMFTEVTKSLETSHERYLFWEFARFFRGPDVKNLRIDIEALPVAEATEMHRTFNKLALDINKVADKLDAEAKAWRAANPEEAAAKDAQKKARNDNKKGGRKPFRNNNAAPKVPGQRFGGFRPKT